MKIRPGLLCLMLAMLFTVWGGTPTIVFAKEAGVSQAQINSFHLLTTEQRFAREQLIATIKLYDDHLRVPETGQYLDKIDTHELRQTSTLSSIASTGVGLISLTIGDQLGVIDAAADKAYLTLANLLNTAPEATFRPARSRSGWYKHFINAYTGEAGRSSREVFSTIDTTILGVGASMVARYFETKYASDPKAQEVVKLANELVQGIDWGQAVRFGPKPGVHQIFHGFEEEIENRFWSIPFDEYVVLPCLGRSVEASRGQRGRASVFWDAYLENVDALPQAEFNGFSVLAVNGKRFTSHFTHQFAFYFCGDLASDESYQAELNEIWQADRKWFMTAGKDAFPDHWWGLGAGSEIKFDKQTGEIRYSGYGVARIGKNPNHTFSPAIMAGFLPVEYAEERSTSMHAGGNSAILEDLKALYDNNECRYDFAGLDFLWRCSARDTSLRVRHIEGVDLSTYMLGLAWFDPSVGKNFFDAYAVKTRSASVKTTPLRAFLPDPIPGTSHRR